MKKFIALLLALTMVLSLVACGKTSDPATDGDASGDKTITISFWLEPCPEWEAQVLADTGIKIEYEQIESKNYFDIMTTRLQGGTASDIFYAYNADATSMYIDAGYPVDLSDCACLSNINENYLEAAKMDGDGKVYGVNEVVSYVNMLFYNKDIFDANNIEVPQNMDEFLAVCQKLKDLGITPFVHGDMESNHLKRTPFEPINIITAQEGGADWVKGLATGDSKFSDETFVKAANYFEQIVSNGYMSDLSNGVTHVEAWDLFCKGEAAMMTGASFYADQNYGVEVPEFTLGIAPAPYNYEGTPKMLAATSGAYIMANAASENRDVIMEYMEYYISHWQDYAKLSGRPMAYAGEGGEWAPYSWIFDEAGTYPTLPYQRETSLIQKDLEAWTQGVLTGAKAADGLADLDARLAAAIG